MSCVPGIERIRRFFAAVLLSAVVFTGCALFFSGTPSVHAAPNVQAALHCTKQANGVVVCWKYAPPAPKAHHHRPRYLVAYAPLQHKMVRYHFRKKSTHHGHPRHTARWRRFWRWYFFYGPGQGQ